MSKLKFDRGAKLLKVQRGSAAPLLVVLIFAGLAPLSWLAGFGIVAILSLVVLLFLAVRSRGSSILESALLSLAIYFSLITAFGAIFWLLGIKLSALALFAIFLSLNLILSWMIARNRVSIFKYQNDLDRKVDLLSLSVILIYAVMFLGAFIVKSGPDASYRFISSAGDNLSHIEHTEVTLREQGYLYQPVEESAKKLTASHTAYPEGLHLNLSLIARGLGDTNGGWSNNTKIRFYHFSFIALYLSLVVALHALTIRLVRGSAGGIGAYLLAFVGISIISLGFGLNLSLYGFQVEVAALMLFIAQLILMTKAYSAKSSSLKHLFSLAGALICVGVGFCWLFLLPVSLIAVASSLIVIYFEDLKSVFKDPLSNKSFLAVAFGVLALAGLSLVQFYAQKEFGIKSDPINEVGWVQVIKLPVCLSLATIALYPLLMRGKIGKSFKFEAGKMFFVFGLTASLFCIIIGAYQYYSVGDFRYYFYKASHPVLVLGIILLVAMLVRLMGETLAKFKPGQLLAVLLIVGLVCSNFYSSKLAAFGRGRLSGISKAASLSLASELSSDEGVENPPLLIGSCDRVEDFVLTRLALVLTDSNTPKRQDLSFAIISASSEQIDDLIIENYDDQSKILTGGADAYNVYSINYPDVLNLNENQPGKTDCPGSIY